MRYFVFVLIGYFLVFSSCTSDQGLSSIDSELYEKAKSTSGYTWYKNSTGYLNKSSGSGHSNPFLRTRFDALASQQLDSLGKVDTNAIFDEGAVIVKELYDSSKGLSRYAILYKQSNSEFADGNGWVWGYINSDGTVGVSAEEKGQACIGCHSQTGAIDNTLMNKYFP